MMNRDGLWTFLCFLFEARRGYKMRLFKVSKAYLNSIQMIDKFIPKNENLVGTIYRLNGYIYFLPVNRDDENDYDADGHVKHSLPFMIRMTEETGMKCYGKCLISNMFAVPYKDLVPLTKKEFNYAYEKRLEYLKRNKTRILNSIKRIYKQKTRGYKQDYLLRTVNFKATEKFAIRYELDNYGKHYNCFPDDNFLFLSEHRKSWIKEESGMDRMLLLTIRFYAIRNIFRIQMSLY